MERVINTRLEILLEKVGLKLWNRDENVRGKTIVKISLYQGIRFKMNEDIEPRIISQPVTVDELSGFFLGSDDTNKS